ncbi:MAG: NAD-dependent deacylase [Candidatus Zixiibacteriota bacterium]|nr:MAG: NAD-dependent deacylase [candidate division Zixibacteria bacterium]
MIEISPELQKVLKSARKVAVLTGAGISAESGVPTFRGEEGLWSKFRAEELATVDAFMRNPELVWEWYMHRRQLMSTVKPNPAHAALVEMEKLYDDFTLITQNIDGLHRQAGSKNILELHGNISLNKCFACGRPFTEDIDLESNQLPACECGGKIRPDVVWFGELLPPDALNRAFDASARAELFLSVGTSAVVHPAASIPLTAKSNGAFLVEVNLEPTPITEFTDWAFHGKAGEIMPAIVESLKK